MLSGLKKLETVKNKKLCIDCSCQIEANQKKYCKACSVVNRYVAKISPATESIIQSYAGKIPIKELSKRAGVSVSTIKRYCIPKGIKTDFYLYSDEQINAVCEYYLKHGVVATREKFKYIKIRSIIEKYAKDFGTPRQIRWTPENLIDLVKMAGVIPNNEQAKYFNRPNAYSGSIKSVWSKRFKSSPSNLNSCPHYIAKHLVKDICPFYSVRGKSRKMVAFWVDVEAYIKSGVSGETRLMVSAMAKFQRWLFGKDHPSVVFSFIK